MVTASVCGCVSTVSALKLRIFTVMDLKLHIWLHGCPVAEKLSVCYLYQVNMEVFISQNVSYVNGTIQDSVFNIVSELRPHE